MKLRQLKYIHEVAKHDFNITAAADVLFTSQPGISKQIRLLEEELGVDIFQRNGKHLTGMTQAGERILEVAARILFEVDNISRAAAEYRQTDLGTLSIATTHTQARYALPQTISNFQRKYPKVSFQLHQGAPPQIAQWAAEGEADFAIATEALEHFSELIMLPCYHWNRCVLVKPDHPLAQMKQITLNAIAQHPIITYTFGFTGRSILDMAFKSQGLNPEVVLTAVDADVIKTYVRLGLGVGIIANMAYDPQQDKDLVALDASLLFESSTTHIGWRRGLLLREYMIEFIHLFAPHITPEIIRQAESQTDPSQHQALVETLWPQVPVL